ncbi:DUF2384 domain-containing protein [Pseudoalteromonas carrageenovora]|uniref:DUF2384 domain-containing protein n=1 Tax=Pseudoalteromonas carrageenovora TaxID=227 RepID=UPI0026E17F51|nr:DUF2384 domain-containing protein [Pseudoalteromonas carrageenovora]MDO6834069.1 DUF2384 domain-containing protein [Pseudoalteromonas carrageenovora]
MSFLINELLTRNPQKTSDVALRVFLNIMEKWKVPIKEQIKLLGQTSEFLLKQKEQGAVMILPNDSLLRISYILGIYKALGTLFPDKKLAHEWITKKNLVFEGKSALDFIVIDSSNRLPQVRGYLDGQVAS